MTWHLGTPWGIALLLTLGLKLGSTGLGLWHRRHGQTVSAAVWWCNKLCAVAACGLAAKVAEDSGDGPSYWVLLGALPLVTLLVISLAWRRYRR